MTLRDDRSEFEDHKRRQAEAMARDPALRNQCIATLKALDRYDYSYLWSWMGLPIIQMPSDIMATQEVVWQTKPEVIVETGVARGGSVIFLASLLQLIGKGRVVGVDIDIRAHNREAIERHPMAGRISLIEGPSTSQEVLQQVRAEIPSGSSVMVILDSDHSRAHVLAELRAYAPLVTEGCYLVVADTVIHHWEHADVNPSRSRPLYRGNEPMAGLNDYLAETDRFEPDPVLNAKLVLASSPGGYLKCVAP